MLLLSTVAIAIVSFLFARGNKDAPLTRTFASDSGWSKYIEFQDDENDTDSYTLHDTVTQQTANKAFNLASPREWLEYHASMRYEGAYTVIRYDLDPLDGTWLNLGEDFHFGRLIKSYQTLQQSTGASQVASTKDATTLQESEKTSREMVAMLLNEAKASLLTGTTPSSSSIKGGQSHHRCITLMMTILWEPDTFERPSVRAHAFTTGNHINPFDISKAITAYLAIPTSPHAKIVEAAAFPNRYLSNPEAKLSSWCSKRRPLENQFKNKPSDEVILLRPTSEQDLHLLEGLTSNLFVVYADGRLKTANNQYVLGGFARQRVLEVATSMGIIPDFSPILLSERDEWEEVFLTSAIRCVVPVERICTVDESANSSRAFIPVWNCSSESSRDSLGHRIFQMIIEQEHRKHTGTVLL